MFCGKCGTQNPDQAAFCKKCGTRLNVQNKPATVTTAKTSVRGPVQPQRGRPAPKRKRRQDKKVGMIAVAVVTVILLITAFALFGGRSYKATIKQFVNAQFDVDAEKLVKLIPDGVLDYTLEEEGFDDLDEMIDELNDNIQDQIDYIERYLGTDWSVSYEITSVEKMPSKDLEKLKKTYKKCDVKVSAAKTVELELTVKAGETENSSSMDISLIKVGNSWYIDVDSMGSLF